jgi:hypothetical protein
VQVLDADVLVLGHAAVAAVEDVGQVLLAQRFERARHRPLVVGDYGVAVRDLVAGVHQRVQRQRVILRRRHLLLDERAEHPHLHVVQ